MSWRHLSGFTQSGCARAQRRSLTLYKDVNGGVGQILADERIGIAQRPGEGVRGVPPGGDGREESGGDGPRADALPQVHRAPRREDLGEEPGGRGLDVYVHDPGGLWPVSRFEVTDIYWQTSKSWSTTNARTAR